jgi:uroporphyrinogen-III synthase
MKKLFISRKLAAESILHRLSGNSMEVVGQSCIDFESVPILEIPESEWLFFYSKQGIKASFENADFKAICLRKNVATFGSATANYFTKLTGKTPEFVGNGVAEDVSSAYSIAVAGTKTTFVQGRQSRRSIQQNQAFVQPYDELEVYESLPLKYTFEQDFDILIFTSPLNAKYYLDCNPILPTSTVIAIGDTTRLYLSMSHHLQALVPEKPSEESIYHLILDKVSF